MALEKIISGGQTGVDRAALDAALGDALSLADLDLVVDAEQVAAGKPDPAAYLFALEQLGEEASDCLAVEDNPGGVAAARAAGVPVAAFPNENTGDQDFGDAPRVDELDLDTLRGLLPAA